MASNPQDTLASLKQSNVIAYDEEIRALSLEAHNMLGGSLTDIFANAVQDSAGTKIEALKVLKQFSDVTARLSIALMRNKASKPVLTGQEQVAFDLAKKLTESLADVQLAINEIIKQINISTEATDKIENLSMDLGQKLLVAQDRGREFLKNTNNYGTYSDKPFIAEMINTPEE